MKRVFTVILVILMVITSLTFGTLYVGTKALNTKTKEVEEKSNEGVGAKYDIKGDKKLVTYAEIYDIDHVNPEIAHKYLDEDLKKYEIPTDALDYVLKEDDYQGMYYDYRTSAIGYLAGKNDKPTLDIERIKEMTRKGLVKYNEDHEKKLDIDKIVNNVEEVAHTIDTKIEELKKNKKLTTALGIVTNDALRIGSFIGILILAAIIILVNSFTDGYKNIGISFIVSGALMALIWLLSKVITIKAINDYIGATLPYIQSKLFVIALLYLAIGITSLLVGIALSRIIPKKEEVKETKEE